MVSLPSLTKLSPFPRLPLPDVLCRGRSHNSASATANTWDAGSCVFFVLGSADLHVTYLLDLTSCKLSAALTVNGFSEPDRRQTDESIKAQTTCTVY